MDCLMALRDNDCIIGALAPPAKTSQRMRHLSFFSARSRCELHPSQVHFQLGDDLSEVLRSLEERPGNACITQQLCLA